MIINSGRFTFCLYRIVLLPFFFFRGNFQDNRQHYSITGERDVRLIFQGHNRSRTVPVAVSDLGRRCRGRHGDTGCFRHHGNWTENNGVLTVQFQPTIYINNTLTGTARANALQHEQRHYKDFRRRAGQLQSALSRVIRARRDPQESAQWSWFLYDLCTDSAAFHRSVGSPVEICIRPSTGRP